MRIALVMVGLLVGGSPTPKQCRNDGECSSGTKCACERRRDCSWWPVGHWTSEKRMTYADVTRRSSDGACLARTDAIARRALLSFESEAQREGHADFQCPQGQRCVCDGSRCSFRVLSRFYVPPLAPPYTTQMCLRLEDEEEALRRQLVRRCGSARTDVCPSADGGVETSDGGAVKPDPLVILSVPETPSVMSPSGQLVDGGYF